MTRDVAGLLAFAALVVALLVAWVYFFWDDIVIYDEPSAETSSQIQPDVQPLTASVAP